MSSSKPHALRAVLLVLLLGAVTLVVVSCSGRREITECYDSSQCSAEVGELVACIDAECETVECLATSDCALGQICDVEGGYQCVDGCNGDSDCPAGFSCTEDGACEEYGCRSTLLDCDFGEFCNEFTGECEEDPAPHCTPCSEFSNDIDIGDPFDSCDDTIAGNFECGGAGAVCTTITVGDGLQLTPQPICYTPCQEEGDCPMGFVCTELTFQNPGCTQSNSLRVCMSDCNPF